MDPQCVLLGIGGVSNVLCQSLFGLVLELLSISSGAWCVGARTELALTLFLSILALAITAAILYVGERRETVAGRRDEAMHAKLDALIRAKPGADDALAGCEQDEVNSGQSL